MLILACAPAWAGAQHAGMLRMADDLAATGQEARARRVPIMLVFTEATCPFCLRAKRNHLAPLVASRDYGDKVIVREVDVTREVSMKDFSGAPVTPAAFARRYNVRVVPTVLVVDAGGRRLADPITGLLIEDFYQLYLEQAVDAGRTALGSAGTASR